MIGLIKLVLAIVFIMLITLGAIFGGLTDFLVTFLMAIIISGMFSRIEKNKLESKRHYEMLQAIEKNKLN